MQKRPSSDAVVAGENWNPYRTPGVPPEEQVPGSPAHTFDGKYRIYMAARAYLAARPRLRGVLALLAAAFVVLYVIQMTVGY
jgi:hypothetical protein